MGDKCWDLKRKYCTYLLKTELYQKERNTFCSDEPAHWHLVQIEEVFKNSIIPVGDKDNSLIKRENYHMLTS